MMDEARFVEEEVDANEPAHVEVPTPAPVVNPSLSELRIKTAVLKIEQEMENFGRDSIIKIKGFLNDIKINL